MFFPPPHLLAHLQTCGVLIPEKVFFLGHCDGHICVYVTCGQIPSIESCSVCGFLCAFMRSMPWMYVLHHRASALTHFQLEFRSYRLRPRMTLPTSRSFGVPFPLKFVIFIVPVKVTVTPELPHYTKHLQWLKGTDSFLMNFLPTFPLFSHSVCTVWLSHYTHISVFLISVIARQWVNLSWDSPVQRMRGHSRHASLKYAHTHHTA